MARVKARWRSIAGAQDVSCLRCEKAPSMFDVPHRVAATVVWAPQAFEGRSGLLPMLLRNWQVSGIFAAQSGRPFSVWNGAAFAAGGDYNADGRSDVLWRNTSSGVVSAWLMNGASRVGGGTVTSTVSNAWKIIGTSDLNGDGRDDLLWRKVSNGDVYGWLMNGITQQGSGFIRNAGTTWSPIK